MSEGRSIWTIDSRNFADPDNDRSLRKHSGRNLRIMIGLRELHSHLYDAMSQFFSSRARSRDKTMETATTRTDRRSGVYQLRTSFKRHITLRKVRRSERQVPLRHLRKCARLVKSSTKELPRQRTSTSQLSSKSQCLSYNRLKHNRDSQVYVTNYWEKRETIWNE